MFKKMKRLCKNNEYEWLMRSNDGDGYFLHIYTNTICNQLDKSIFKAFGEDLNILIKSAILLIEGEVKRNV